MYEDSYKLWRKVSEACDDRVYAMREEARDRAWRVVSLLMLVAIGIRTAQSIYDPGQPYVLWGSCAAMVVFFSVMVYLHENSKEDLADAHKRWAKAKADAETRYFMLWNYHHNTSGGQDLPVGETEREWLKIEEDLIPEQHPSGAEESE